MKGFSLPVVLYLLGLGGALAVSGAFVARQEAAGQRAGARGAGLDGVAEEALGRGMVDWDTTQAIAVGDAAALPVMESPNARIERWITRTDSSVYWITVDVSSTLKPLLRRRLGAPVVRGANGLLPLPGWGRVELR